MVRKELTIINKLGMHARAAAKFVSLASNFESEVALAKGARRVNGKSIMGVMMLAAAKGSIVTLYVEGGDEQDAVRKLEDLINCRFGEAE